MKNLKLLSLGIILASSLSIVAMEEEATYEDLETAVKENKPEEVARLLGKTFWDSKLLSDAIERSDNPEIIQLLRNELTKKLFRILKHAANLTAVNSQVESGADPLATDKDGNTVLHILISATPANSYKTSAEIIPYFIFLKKVDPNKKNNNGVTPLMLAASKRSIFVERLLNSAPNIDVNVQDKRGYTALDYAKRDSDSKKILEAHGAKSGKNL